MLQPAGALWGCRRHAHRHRYRDTHSAWAVAVAVVVASMALAPALHAQAVLPDAAAEFLRQQERERALRGQMEERPAVHLPSPTAPALAAPPRLPVDESPCFPISRIVLAGDAAAAFGGLLDAAHRSADGSDDPAVGRCLGSQGVEAVATRVNNAIIARGYVTTRVLLAPQNLAGGTLTLTLVPGRIAAIRLAPESGERAFLGNAMPMQAGDLLNLRDIEQALENLQRVPTVEADIDIVPAAGPGAAPGESDLVVRWSQRAPARATLSVDDSGARSTGTYQSSATVSIDHPLGLNDLFYASASRDLGGGDPGPRGTRGGTVHYSVPRGYWLFGLTGSAHRYHQQVAGADQAYRYSGDSRNAQASLERLVWRDAVRKSAIGLSAWARSSSNFIDDTEVEVQRQRMAGWELALRHREALADATLDAVLHYRRGTGAFHALPAPGEEFGEGTSRLAVAGADVRLAGWLRLAGQALRYSTQWRAQWNRTPLVAQDRFSIGGRYTVRGFDGESTLSAERGWLVRNELSWPLGEDIAHEPYIGLDHGEVAGASAPSLAGRRLTGAVAGWRAQAGPAHLDLFIGWPLRKPEGLRTAHTTAGMSLYLTF